MCSLAQAQPVQGLAEGALENTNTAEPCVVLLHGLARTNRSMRKIASALKAEGYRIANIDYPSRQNRVEELADLAVTAGLERCQTFGAERIHFVTHSLGGILVRYFLTQHELPNLGRVVMLGPPNHGSEIVDALRDVPGYFLLNGPAGNQLGTDPDAITRQLGPVNYPVGVIAGTKSINLILSIWLPDPDDGKVSVRSTHLEGMSDLITVPVAHPFLPGNREVIAQILKFLHSGNFDHAQATRYHAAAAELWSCEQTGELDDCGAN